MFRDAKAEGIVAINPFDAVPPPDPFTEEERDGVRLPAFFGQRSKKLKIRKHDFYSTRDTFISVLLTYGYHPTQIADVCGNSPAMIFRHYTKWIKTEEKFGERALKPEPLPTLRHTQS